MSLLAEEPLLLLDSDVELVSETLTDPVADPRVTSIRYNQCVTRAQVINNNKFLYSAGREKKSSLSDKRPGLQVTIPLFPLLIEWRW